jgi:transposase
MLTVETIKKVRLAAFRDMKPIKQIAKDLRLSRNTVRKILREDLTEIRYVRKNQPRPALAEFIEPLDRRLSEDKNLPRKRRRNAVKLYEEIMQEGYAGSYDNVQRYVRAWRRQQEVLSTQAYVPLVFEPGEAFQFDWSHEDVELGGLPATVKVAHIRLCYSRMNLIIAYPRETQEMVFDAHIQAFQFFGGSCRRGIYDNMKTAVKAILVGKQRDFNTRFIQLCSHYLYDPVACTPAAGWEKGQVERQVGVARGKFFVPRPRCKDLAELNERLRSQCLALARSASHPTMPEKTVWEAFEEERPHLMHVPRPFNGYAESPARVSTTSLVTIDRNRYSVPVSEVGRTVQVRAYADSVIIVNDGRVISEHVRQFGRGKMIFDPWHYLPILERKPGAIRNGAPFKGWDLPDELVRTRAALERFPDWDRQFVGILCAIPTYGLAAVAYACDQALGMKVMSKDVVLNFLSRGNEEKVDIPIALPHRLLLREEPVADCGRYDALLGEVSHVTQ